MVTDYNVKKYLHGHYNYHTALLIVNMFVWVSMAYGDTQ